MIKWRKSRQDTEYKPGLNSRREHNAQRSYIGHAQRINFGRPRPKFPAQNFKRRPPKETTAFTQNMVRENSRLFAHILLLITGFLLIYYYVLSFHYRKHCRVFKHHDLLAWVVIYIWQLRTTWFWEPECAIRVDRIGCRYLNDLRSFAKWTELGRGSLCFIKLDYGKPIVAIFNSFIYIKFNIYIYVNYFLYVQFNIYIYIWNIFKSILFNMFIFILFNRSISI